MSSRSEKLRWFPQLSFHFTVSVDQIHLYTSLKIKLNLNLLWYCFLKSWLCPTRKLLPVRFNRVIEYLTAVLVVIVSLVSEIHQKAFAACQKTVRNCSGKEIVFSLFSIYMYMPVYAWFCFCIGTRIWYYRKKCNAWVGSKNIKM